MKIFILGLSNSGRTTVAKHLADEDSLYISAMDWVKSTFRPKELGEDNLDFERSFNEYYSERIKVNPFLIAENIEEIIKSCPHNRFIVDGVLNPQNFMKLFDYNQDVLIVLNRIDNTIDSTDQDNIALNVIRDYCYWLSSMNLLDKDRWIEYNFRINAKGDGTVKKMGTRNIVYIIKSIDNVITHVKDVVKSIL